MADAEPLPHLGLPGDRPRPSAPLHRVATHGISLEPATATRLRALGEVAGAKASLALLAVLHLLLTRLGGEDNVAIAVGPLLVRIDLRGDPSFRELLGRVREARERARPAPAGVQVAFSEEGVASAHPGVSPFELELVMSDRAAGVDLALRYSLDIFDLASAARIGAQFAALAEQVSFAPEAPAGTHSLVMPEDRDLLPDPGAPLPAPPQELIPDVFTGWAARSPELEAVRQGGRSWTYGELARSADGIGRMLVGAGLVGGGAVALAGPPSYGFVAAAMGVLRAGGALLPLEEAVPPAHRARLLAAAGVRLAVHACAPEAFESRRWGAPDLVHLRVDTQRGEVAAPGCAELPELPTLTQDSPAYVIFTSGSTGPPRGVLGRHGSIAQFLAWERERFAVGPGDRCAQLTNLSFDPVLRDLFLPLTSGAACCLPDLSCLLTAETVVPWLDRERITILHSVPSLAQWWLAGRPGGGTLESVRWVLFAGEPLPGSLVRAWRRAFPRSGRIANLYGPTETTQARCAWIVPTDVQPGVQPVGHPLPSTQALVLSPAGRPCGIGEVGEIAIRTPFRSLGYVGGAKESRRGFEPSPFRQDEADLLFRTGDRGRYRADGSLEVLGRLDDQVKIRGVRVYPSEVAASIGRHPGVAAVAVVCQRAGDGREALVAYVVRAARQSVTVSHLAGFLRDELPPAMIPSRFVFLDRLPVTPNGKVDRRRLALMGEAAPDSSVHEAPRTDTEWRVAALWNELLGVERVGIHDSFFALGGDSLAAMQLVSRIQRAFGVELTVAVVLEAQTVAGVAEAIRGGHQLAARPITRLPRESAP